MLYGKKLSINFLRLLLSKPFIFIHILIYFFVGIAKSDAYNTSLVIYTYDSRLLETNNRKLYSTKPLKTIHTETQKLYNQQRIKQKDIFFSTINFTEQKEEDAEFNLHLQKLKINSNSLNRQLYFYELYPILSWAIAIVFIVLIGIIFFLIQTIKKQQVAEKILRDNERRYQAFAQAGADILWELDSNLKLNYISGNLELLDGLLSGEVLGKSLQEIYKNNPQIDFDWDYFEQMITSKSPIKDLTFIIKEDKAKAKIFKINGHPLFKQQKIFLGYRGIKREITEEYNLNQAIAYQAAYDPLTGLLNRREFDFKLKDVLKHTQKYGAESVLCYFDLDQFKIINDIAGHLVGDRLLAELAQLLKATVKPGDTLGRLGGDEFALLLEICSIEQAKKVCNKIINKIENYRFKWEDRQFDVGVSIGIVPISDTSSQAAELLIRADIACYKAKDLGRNKIYIATEDDSELNLHQVQMAYIANVSQIIEENRFYLVKQPIATVNNYGNVSSHYEVLLRLKDEQGNLIPPGQFIPVAERYGVISIIDKWVLETTLKCYKQIASSQKVLVSINLSGASINNDRFTNYALDCIAKSEIDPQYICFEITETTAISQLDRAKNFIQAMKELGVKFALDDFGSGVASFAYLKNLPVDYLKIDGSLVKNIAQEKNDKAIVNLINEIAHMMNIKTIAEFVEDDETLAQLKEIGIDYAQGYGIARPSDLESKE